ncbi:transcription factor Cys6 [Niveomyces insectorum RCEF 264]|uniref:Transcription factor Cys6 n=1 Tax=Niveomyces insectorum RCEF 264 TaxID=1081102 RepID=A0A167XPZ6_9HYPO|nr:transcription factor Cys6 [Niveomyces insectorum RCEF 264]
MPRKTTGCWTCRARKKKCDDGRPSCAACALRALVCYGYGAKPGWMDGGDQERTVLASMNRRAKESYSERRRARAARVARHGSLASTETGTATGLPSPSPGSATGPFGDACVGSSDRQSSCDGVDLLPTTARSSPQSPPPPPLSHRSVRAFLYNETELSLLMYYFDHVFPRLAPFFTYSAADGGRGWLLSLLLRTKPLGAAAICISACDQAQFVLGPLSDIPQPNHDLETKHIQSVVDLRAHLTQLAQQTGASRMAVAVEALACIMHLILFEVALLWIPRKDQLNDWVMHLDAASALLSSVDFTMAGRDAEDAPLWEACDDGAVEAVAEDTTTSAVEDVAGPSPGQPPSPPPQPSSPSSSSSSTTAHDVARFFPVAFLSDGDRAAFDFFLTMYTYCFIVAAVGQGLTARSAASVRRTRAIFHRGQSKLRDMFGCEDAILITLLDIAVLRHWKQRAQRDGTLSVRALTRRAAVLERRLAAGAGAGAATTTTTTTSTTTAHRDEQIRMITATYRHAGLLFLHVVVSGFYPHLPEIRAAVLQTRDALAYMRAHGDTNFPSWPFCVAGCLALPADYPHFRALLPPPQAGTHPLVLTMWTLSIVERCWQLRRAQAAHEETVDWVAAMNDLGTRLLLL